MALFIPYFILLHLNNKLRKEVEGALNRVLELKVYSQMIDERLVEFMEVSNINFDSQDKNWENQKKISKSFTESFLIADQNFKGYYENFENIVNEIEKIEKIVNQKQTLKEILENPIEVKKPACETRLKLKEEVNANDIQTVTEVKNKFDFIISSFNFQRLDIFKKWDDFLYVFRKGKMEESFELKTDLAKAVWNKVIELNEPKPKRKYTKRKIKNEN
jgi:hypothetical protein